MSSSNIGPMLLLLHQYFRTMKTRRILAQKLFSLLAAILCSSILFLKTETTNAFVSSTLVFVSSLNTLLPTTIKISQLEMFLVKAITCFWPSPWQQLVPWEWEVTMRY